MDKRGIKYGEHTIYIIENDIHNIKIGITNNFENRLHSLSNSNSGGHKIINTYESPKTYLYCLETLMHRHFDKYRIEGEWFHGITFSQAVEYLNFLMSDANDYSHMNDIRRRFNERINHKEEQSKHNENNYCKF